MSGARRRLGPAVAVLLAGPLLVLPVWAVADVWRAPALLPQELGLRGLRVLASPGTGTPTAVANSLVVGVATVALALVLAWPAAQALAAARRATTVGVLVLLALPLLIPPYALGVGLTEWFLRLGLSDSLPGLVLAHLVVVLPYVVVTLLPGFDVRLRRLQEAAATLGAPPRQVLVHVTLPHLAPVLAVAALLGFVVSWSQYGTSLAVGGGIPMLPLLLEPFVGRDPQVAAGLALVFLVPPLLALALTVRRTPRA